MDGPIVKLFVSQFKGRELEFLSQYLELSGVPPQHNHVKEGTNYQFGRNKLAGNYPLRPLC